MNDILCQLNSLFGKEAVRLSPTDVFTPQWVVKDMVNLLPAEVFNPNTTFLDPAVKSGRFLIELYDRLMKSPSLQSAFPDETERSTHILTNQLYGFSTSNKTALLARTSLYGEPFTQGNIRYIKDYTSFIKDKEKFEGLVKGFRESMKFDVVIGNPPYQENTGGGGNSDSGKALYQYFVNTAFSVCNKYVCMITKNSWYRARDTSGNIGFNRMKAMLLKEGKLVKIVDFPKYFEVFDGIGCSVSYFLADMEKESNNYCIETIIDKQIQSSFSISNNSLSDVIRSAELAHIANKTFSKKNMSQFTLAKLAFGIDTTGVINSSATRTEKANIALVGKLGTDYIQIADVTKNMELIMAYKVICTRAVSAWSTKRENVITSVRLLEPWEVCTGTYSVIFYNHNRDEAESALKYMKTKFVRQLLKCMIDARGVISSTTFEYVPIQDFTSNSDIDWSKSIADIDQQLYTKYNLTNEEIDYIEDTIKPMV